MKMMKQKPTRASLRLLLTSPSLLNLKTTFMLLLLLLALPLVISLALAETSEQSNFITARAKFETRTGEKIVEKRNGLTKSGRDDISNFSERKSNPMLATNVSSANGSNSTEGVRLVSISNHELEKEELGAKFTLARLIKAEHNTTQTEGKQTTDRGAGHNAGTNHDLELLANQVGERKSDKSQDSSSHTNVTEVIISNQNITSNSSVSESVLENLKNPAKCRIEANKYLNFNDYSHLTCAICYNLLPLKWFRRKFYYDRENPYHLYDSIADEFVLTSEVEKVNQTFHSFGWGFSLWSKCCSAATECCRQNSATLPRDSNGQPIYFDAGDRCHGTWDGISCWPDTKPDTLAMEPCRDYIYSYGKPLSCRSSIRKQCFANASWYIRKGHEWSDYSGCLASNVLDLQLSISIAYNVIATLFVIPALVITQKLPSRGRNKRLKIQFNIMAWLALYTTVVSVYKFGLLAVDFARYDMPPTPHLSTSPTDAALARLRGNFSNNFNGPPSDSTVANFDQIQPSQTSDSSLSATTTETTTTTTALESPSRADAVALSVSSLQPSVSPEPTARRVRAILYPQLPLSNSDANNDRTLDSPNQLEIRQQIEPLLGQKELEKFDKFQYEPFAQGVSGGKSRAFREATTGRVIGSSSAQVVYQLAGSNENHADNLHHVNKMTLNLRTHGQQAGRSVVQMTGGEEPSSSSSSSPSPKRASRAESEHEFEDETELGFYRDIQANKVSMSDFVRPSRLKTGGNSRKLCKRATQQSPDIRERPFIWSFICWLTMLGQLYSRQFSYAWMFTGAVYLCMVLHFAPRGPPEGIVKWLMFMADAFPAVMVSSYVYLRVSNEASPLRLIYETIMRYIKGEPEMGEAEWTENLDCWISYSTNTTLENMIVIPNVSLIILNTMLFVLTLAIMCRITGPDSTKPRLSLPDYFRAAGTLVVLYGAHYAVVILEPPSDACVTGLVMYFVITIVEGMQGPAIAYVFCYRTQEGQELMIRWIDQMRENSWFSCWCSSRGDLHTSLRGENLLRLSGRTTQSTNETIRDSGEPITEHINFNDTPENRL